MWRCVSVILLVLTALPVWGNSQSLDTWLRDKAAPKLAEVLGKHPKFKGSRIRFVGVEVGQPIPIGNELAAEISRVLTHRVLQAGAADVESPSSRVRCRRILTSEPYLVGIDIQSDGRSLHRVNLAIMDPEEAVWVAGVSLSWRGRLTSAEARALRTRVKVGPAGSVDRPIALSAEGEIVERMLQQVRCALPSGLEGTVALRQPADPRLVSISTALEQQLVLEPGFVLAAGDEADWQMQMDVTDAGSRRLVLTLVPSDLPETRQQLASLVMQATAAVTAPSVAEVVPPLERPQFEALLSELDIASRAPCRSGSSDCVEVGFTIDKAAHVLVFRTHAAEVVPTSCSSRHEIKPAGDLRYRVRLPNGSPDPTGIYVVASEQREPIRRLRKIVQAAASQCNARDSGGDWRRSLIEAAAVMEERLAWRVVHLEVNPSDRSIRRI